MTFSLVFQRFGGSLQLRLSTFSELLSALEVPEALWVATACPTRGLACDARFLQLLDADGNGRIRPEELKAAVHWAAAQLTDTTGASEGSDVLQLAHLSESAAPLRASAELILETLAAPDTTRISLAQVRESEAAFRAGGINGDGILAPEGLKDAHLSALLRLLLSVLPPRTNRAGQAGLDASDVEAFRARRREVLAHLEARAAAFVWGETSLQQAERVRAVEGRLEEFFLQCRLVAAQPEARAHLKLDEAKVEGTLGDVGALEKWARALPLAPPNPQGELRWEVLHRGPAYEALRALQEEVAAPLLGARDVLTEADFRRLQAAARTVLAWKEKAEAERLLSLGEEALRGVREEALDALGALSRTDAERRERLEGVAPLEKLLLFQRWLLAFANTFISMPHLYNPRQSALFEQGRLVLAGRELTLSVLVPDRAAHVALAEQSNTCLAYVRVHGREGVEPYEVVVPVTSGNSVGVVVGKRGIFRDREGREFDATVTHVVRQPVSLWEAMTQPFTRLGRFVAGKVSTLASESDKGLDTALESGWKQVAVAPAPAAAPAAAGAPAAAAPAGLAGLVAAGGVALAALGSSAAFIVNQLRSTTVEDLLRAAVAVALLLMVPSGLVGWLKLRRRNLAIVLEGSGWALNDRLLLTRAMGALFTRRPARPRGTRVDRTDLAERLLLGRRAREGDAPVRERPERTLGLLLALLAALLALWYWRAPLQAAWHALRGAPLPPPTAVQPGPKDAP